MGRLMHHALNFFQERLNESMQILEILIKRRTTERCVAHQFVDRQVTKVMLPKKSDRTVHDYSAGLFRGMTARAFAGL
jgi:hypothetical protein